MGRHKWVNGYLVYHPDRIDIRRACKRIQAKWSDEERERRAGVVPPPPWTIPEVDDSFMRRLGKEIQDDE